MQGIISSATAVMVTFSVTVYLSVMAVLAWKLVLEEPPIRRAMVPPLFPVFCQNVGIPLAILGFTFRATDLEIAALLLIGLGLLSRDEKSASLHPNIEMPLLIFAIVTLAAVAAVNLFA